MTFNVNPRESISRCEVYENKFRAYPEEARLKETRRLQASDTLESEANQKERYLVEKFRQGILNVDTGGLRYVKQVGRFIFAAFTLPIAFIAVQAPKLVIEYGFPFIADVSGFLMGKFTPLSSALAAWVVSVSGALQEQFNRYFLRKLEKFHGFLKSSKDFLKQRFSGAFETVRNRLKRLMAPLSRFKEHQKRLFHQAWEKFKKSLPAFTLPRFKWPAIRIKKPHINWPMWKLPALRFPSYKLDLKRYVLPIFNILKAIWQFIYEVGKANYEIWIEPWVFRFIRLAGFLKRILARVALYFKLKLEGLLIPIVALVRRLKVPLPRIKISISLPKIKLPSLPSLPSLPKLSMPSVKISLPKFKLPKLKPIRNPLPSLKEPLENAWLHFKVFLKVLFEQLS